MRRSVWPGEGPSHPAGLSLPACLRSSGQPSGNAEKQEKNLPMRGTAVLRQVRLWTFDHPPVCTERGWASRMAILPWNAARVWLPHPLTAARHHRFAACSFPVRWPRPLAEIPYRFPCAKVSRVAGIERRHIGPQLERLRLAVLLSRPGCPIRELHRLTGNQRALGWSIGPSIALLDLPTWRCGQDDHVVRAVEAQLAQ